MSYSNRNYGNSRGRYNTPGSFVPAGELAPGPQQRTTRSSAANFDNFANLYTAAATGTPPQPKQQPQQQPPAANCWNPEPPADTDVKMEAEPVDAAADSQGTIAPWMKSKLTGVVKKVSNRERRRRQNESLRRLISPKNALTVLNEMLPGEALTGQFKVEQEAASTFYHKVQPNNFCADLTVEGNTYKGYGENKVAARNSAAEQAIRDLILKRMTKCLRGDSAGAAAAPAPAAPDADGDPEALPMIQLASFALHKLFAEWECEGHKVPQLRQPAALPPPAAVDAAEPGAAGKPRAPKAPRTLPADAHRMHPCTLLTYMRSGLEYRELATEGDKPQNMLFTMGVDVDGQSFAGQATNKKEARRLAAKAACETIFGITFDATTATANANANAN